VSGRFCKLTVTALHANDYVIRLYRLGVFNILKLSRNSEEEEEEEEDVYGTTVM